MTDLRNLLNELSSQAKVYDVAQRARAGGLRRRRRKRLMVGGGAALSISSVLIGLTMVPAGPRPPEPLATAQPPVSAAPTGSPEPLVSCVASELPQPPGYPRKAAVTGADPTGRFVLGRAYPGGSGDQLLIWDGDAVKTVAMGGEDGTLEDITTSGVAVGNSFIGDNPVSWIYRNGKMTRLAGDNATALALNESLTVVGVADDRPVMWRTPASRLEPLALPPGEWISGGARGISDDGYIVGFAVAKAGDGRAGKTVGLMWRPDGTVEQLTLPSVYTEPGAVSPTAIRGDWILGRFTKPDDRVMNVRWNRRTGYVAVFPEPIAWTLNAMGWTAGMSEPALTLTSGRVVTLPTNIEGYQGKKSYTGSFYPDGIIEGISDDGRQVVGSLHDEALTILAVRWTCG